MPFHSIVSHSCYARHEAISNCLHEFTSSVTTRGLYDHMANVFKCTPLQTQQCTAATCLTSGLVMHNTWRSALCTQNMARKRRDCERKSTKHLYDRERWKSGLLQTALSSEACSMIQDSTHRIGVGIQHSALFIQILW